MGRAGRIVTGMCVARARQELESGATHRQIQDRLSVEFGMRPRAVRNWIKRAYEQLSEEEREQRPRRKIEARLTLRRIREKAETAGDWKAAVAAADREARLDGLFADAVTINHELGAETAAKMRALSPVKQREHMAALIAAKLAADPALLADVRQRATALLPAPIEVEVEAEVGPVTGEVEPCGEH
ncbi:MAG: hypothetical protein IT370_09355 [Deltaproteobacteria bacterium]|nr:hypothetical protein [Deltaproteobacteria bacterium]